MLCILTKPSSFLLTVFLLTFTLIKHQFPLSAYTLTTYVRVVSLPGVWGGVAGRPDGLSPGNAGRSSFQLAPVLMTTAGELSSVLVSGEVRRSRHKLDTEKSLHLPEPEVLVLLLLVVVELVVDINMVTRCESRHFYTQPHKHLISLIYHWFSKVFHE